MFGPRCRWGKVTSEIKQARNQAKKRELSYIIGIAAYGRLRAGTSNG